MKTVADLTFRPVCKNRWEAESAIVLNGQPVYHVIRKGMFGFKHWMRAGADSVNERRATTFEKAVDWAMDCERAAIKRARAL